MSVIFPHLQLDFVAELPPLSLTVYHVTSAAAGSSHRAQYTLLNDAAPQGDADKHFRVSRPAGDEAAAPLSLSNQHVQMWSSPESGLLQVRKASSANRICLACIMVTLVVFFLILLRFAESPPPSVGSQP